MSDDLPTRSQPRRAYHARVRVRIKSWAQFADMYAQDLSVGGMFLRTATPPPAGTSLSLEIVDPDGVSVNLRGEVAHAIDAEEAIRIDRAPGAGIRFVDLTEEHRRALAWLLAQAGRVAAVGSARLPPLLGDEERLASLRSQLSELRQRDFFEVLGVPSHAEWSDVRRAYLVQVKRWHPSQFAEAPAELRSVAAQIFDLVEHSYDTLSDPCKLTVLRNTAKRRISTEYRQIKGDVVRVEPPQGAAVRLAERLAAQQRFTDARKVLRGALQHDADNWALRETYAVISGCAALQGDHEDEAIPHFEEALRLNPQCAAAIRELRSINERRRDGGAPVARMCTSKLPACRGGGDDDR